MRKSTITIAGKEVELLPELNDQDDVLRWFVALTDAGLNFHPEDRFSNMIDYRTGEASMSEEDAEAMDAKMDEAYAVVGDGDVCEIALLASYSREALTEMKKEPTRVFSFEEIAVAAFGEFSEAEGRGVNAVERLMKVIALTTDYKPRVSWGVGFRLAA